MIMRTNDNQSELDTQRGYRMIVFVIRDNSSPGGLHLRTDWCYGDMEFCQDVVNSVLPVYKYRMIGWKITNCLPVEGLEK